MLIEKSINNFINEVDSETPVPGGGSVSALLGGLGVSLTSMFGKLSINKKAFLVLDEEIRKQFIISLNKLVAIKEQLLVFVDHDTNMYIQLLAAYKLPKSNENELDKRKQAIYHSTIEVTKSPLMMMELALNGLEIASYLIDYGNKNALSDLGVGIICLFGTINGGYLNVKINLSGLNEEDRNVYMTKSSTIKEKATILYNEIMNKIA